MISRSDRIALNNIIEGFDNISSMPNKIIDAINFINKYICDNIPIPFGYHKCPRCNSKIILDKYNDQRYNFLSTNNGNCVYLVVCGFCNGSGFVDFCKNARGNINDDNNHAYTLPIVIFKNDIDEIVSTILYYIFFKQTHFKLESPFNLKNKPKYKYQREFLDYFKKYKKQRDQRVQLLNDYLKDIQKNCNRHTQVKIDSKHALLCDRCKGHRFKIMHCEYQDLLMLKICANCLGKGFTTNRRDSKADYEYVFDLYHSNYRSVDEVIENICFSIETITDGLEMELYRTRNKLQ